jgi:hypothetical protein
MRRCLGALGGPGCLETRCSWEVGAEGRAGNRAGPWKALTTCDAAAPRGFSSCLGSDFGFREEIKFSKTIGMTVTYLPRNQEFLWEILLKSGFRDNGLERGGQRPKRSRSETP